MNLRTSELHVLDNTLFNHYGKRISGQILNQKNTFPFKHHAQLKFIADCLRRKSHHHMILNTPLPAHFNELYFEAMVASLGSQAIFFDITPFITTEDDLHILERDVFALADHIKQHDGLFLLGINDSSDHSLKNTLHYLLPLIHHTSCRLVIFKHQHHEHIPAFIDVQLNPLSDHETLALLEHEKSELEKYHHLSIPHDVLSHTYTLAKRYLNKQQTLHQATLLLDSACARARGLPTENGQAVVTQQILNQTISDWIGIPATLLNLQKFNEHLFTEHVSHAVFGQEKAVQALANKLKHAFARLSVSPAPLATFLFVGAPQTGKKTLANALTHGLFQSQSFLYVTKNMSADSLEQITLTNHNQQVVSIKTITEHAPFSVIFFDRIETASDTLLSELSELAATGKMRYKNELLDLSQCIIILSTRLCAEKLAERQTSDAQERDDLNLASLIMQPAREARTKHTDHQMHELTQTIEHDLTVSLPRLLIEETTLVLFFPLEKQTIHKMIVKHLHHITHTLKERFHITFRYADEVITHMKHMTIDKKADSKKVMHAIDQVIEMAVLNRPEPREKSLGLYLQLNETGQALKYEWHSIALAGEHAT